VAREHPEALGALFFKRLLEGPYEAATAEEVENVLPANLA